MENKIVIKGILFILLLMLCALPITPKTAIEDDIAAEEDKIEKNILETAATEEEIELVIANGLAWLAEQQCDDGGWLDEWPQDRVSPTGFIVLKMEDRAIELGFDTPFDPDYEYSTNVINGLNFIFQYARYDPDFDVIYFVHPYFSIYFPPYYYHLNYETSIAMMAIAASDTPERKVDVSDIYGSPHAFTYLEVMEKAVNYLSISQRADGGWGYLHPGTGVPALERSDNSNTGYVVLGLTYAETRFGIDIDQSVKSSLSEYINYIQNDDNGGSGYTTPDEWVNLLKTGNLLFEMAFVGDDSGTARSQAAIHYIEDNFEDDPPDPFLRWNYQSVYTVMKGFEAMGIETITVGGYEIDWFYYISNSLIDGQLEDGSWPPGLWPLENPPLVLSTVWALLTLERVIEIPEIQANVDIKPGSWPNPINSKSQGVFAVAFCGTEHFDVLEIDTATIEICFEGVIPGVTPLRWSYEDVATPYTGEEGGGHTLEGDGYIDMVLHFDTQEVVNVLGLSVHAGETIPLIVRGNLYEEYDGIPIEGQDYAYILQKKGK